MAGLVLKSKGAHHALVQFDGGDEQSVSKQFVIPTKGAVAVPTLLVGVAYCISPREGTL